MSRLARWIYALYANVYSLLWRLAWVRPGGNVWHAERGGTHTPRTDRPLWLHAASLGEVQVVRAYVEALRDTAPLYLTVQTETGHAAARRLLPDLPVAFAPVDRPAGVQRFLERVAPRGLVLFETEIWPHWLLQIEGPVWFANARLSRRSFRRYRRVRGALAPLWRAVRAVHAQSDRDRDRFAALGVAREHLEVAGQVKQFALEWAPDPTLRAAWRQRLGIAADEALWIGGSIRNDEFETVLDLWSRARAGGQSARLVVAPRHLRDAQDLRRAAQKRGLEVAGVSACSPGSPATGQLLLLDSHGELGALYAAGDLALLGGTFAPHGGHNPNEPAHFGVPVVTGPCTEEIEGDLALLARAGLAVRLENLADFPLLARELGRLDRAEACRRVAELLSHRVHPARRLREAIMKEPGFDAH